MKSDGYLILHETPACNKSPIGSFQQISNRLAVDWRHGTSVTTLVMLVSTCCSVPIHRQFEQ